MRILIYDYMTTLGEAVHNLYTKLHSYLTLSMYPLILNSQGKLQKR